MEGKVTVYYETMNSVRLTAKYEDFEPFVSVEKKSKAEQWREAYFELLSWKNTWRTASVDLLSYHDHEPYVEVVFYETHNVDGVVEWMEGIGYKVKRADFPIAMVETPYDDNVCTDENGNYLFWMFE